MWSAALQRRLCDRSPLTNSRLYRETLVDASGASAEARSARPGRGNRGPTFEASLVTLLFGMAQEVAHQRDAYFGISHIFTHPPRAFDIPQWQ
jgi:hypothetical protein